MQIDFSKMTFVNHHLHTHYSLMDCITKVDTLVDELHDRKHKYCTITEHGTIASTYEQWKNCNKNGMTPILGCECYFVDSYDDPGSAIAYNYGHIIVLAMNNTGWVNLKKLQHIAWEKGYMRKPRIQLTDLCKHNEGLIITTGCMRGPIGIDFLGRDKYYGTLSEKERNKRLYKRCRMLKKAFGDRFYAEIQLLELEEQIRLNKKVIAVAKKLDMPVLVTGDCHYLCKEDVRVHDAMICIGRKEKLNDQNNTTYPTNQLWLKTAEELNVARKKWYPYISAKELKGYILEANKLSERVEDYPIRPEESSLPKFSKRPGKLTRKICDKHRDAHLLEIPEYRERFEMEFDVIERLGYLDYFLVVWDLAKYARANEIPYNARGSVCGSLIAYLMSITWIDPIKFDLPFERFLTEDRVSLPDIDMDFSSKRRDQMVHYLQERWGEECVVHICNYLKWKPKQAFKDVGRIMEYDFQLLNRLTNKVEDNISEWSDFAEIDAIDSFLQDNEDIEPLAEKLIGVIRQQGIHASGVVLTPGPCVQWLPISYRTDKGKRDQKLTKVTEWDMYALEELDILKLDFLGVNHLDIVADAIKLINNRHEVPWKDLDELYAVILDDNCSDSAVYEMIQQERTVGTFQLGTSDGMRALGKHLIPTSIDEIVAMIALYRTALLKDNLHMEYVHRKFGKEYKYPHKKMATLLDNTHGIMLYQEQVSGMSKVLAGFTGTEADHFRKGIKAKDAKKFAVWKKKFIDGCAEHSNMNEKTSTKVWNFIEKFAGYGFNKAHSATYGVFAYMTAWLKCHYYVEYMTALLSCNANDDKKLAVYITEVIKTKHSMRPPHINLSEEDFVIVKDTIMYPLESIKGVGEKALTSILETRRLGGRYKDLEDFLNRVNRRVVNVGVVCQLILSGAMRKFGTIEEVYDDFRATHGAKDPKSRQMYCTSCRRRYPIATKTSDIVDKGLTCPNCDDPEVFYEDGGALPRKFRKKKFDKKYLDQHVFGFSAEECQLKQFADVIIKERCIPLPDIDNYEEKDMVRVAFQVTKIKQIIDKNGGKMAFLDVTDGNYDSSITIFASDWESLESQIKQGACYAGLLVVSRGKLMFSSWKKTYLKRLVNNFRGS